MTFDHLERLADNIGDPMALADALELVESAGVTPLNAEAIRYYVSEGRR